MQGVADPPSVQRLVIPEPAQLPPKEHVHRITSRCSLASTRPSPTGTLAATWDGQCFVGAGVLLGPLSEQSAYLCPSNGPAVLSPKVIGRVAVLGRLGRGAEAACGAVGRDLHHRSGMSWGWFSSRCCHLQGQFAFLLIACFKTSSGLNAEAVVLMGQNYSSVYRVSTVTVTFQQLHRATGTTLPQSALGLPSSSLSRWEATWSSCCCQEELLVL